MAETRVTTVKTMSYNGSLPRNEIPEGFTIEGWQDDGHFFASVANSLMKQGWWVAAVDTKIITPPQPNKTLVHVIKVYDDGSLEIDGVPYEG